MANNDPSEWRTSSVQPRQKISLDEPVASEQAEPDKPERGIQLQRLETKTPSSRSPLPLPNELSESPGQPVVPVGWPPPRLNLGESGESITRPSQVVNRAAAARSVEAWEAPLQLIEQSRKNKGSEAGNGPSSSSVAAGTVQPAAPPLPVNPNWQKPVQEAPTAWPEPDPETEPPSVVYPPPPEMTKTEVVLTDDPPARKGKSPIPLMGALGACGLVIGTILFWPPGHKSAAQTTKSPQLSASNNPAGYSASPVASVPQPSRTPEVLASATPTPEVSASPNVVETPPGSSSPVATLPTPTASPESSATPAEIAAKPEQPKPSATPKPQTYDLAVKIEGQGKRKVFVLGEKGVRLEKEATNQASFAGLKPGHYRLKVLSSGYLDYEKSFDVPATKTLTAQLQKIPSEPVYHQPSSQSAQSAPAAPAPAYTRPYNPPAYSPPPVRYSAPARPHEINSNF